MQFDFSQTLRDSFYATHINQKKQNGNHPCFADTEASHDLSQQHHMDIEKYSENT